MQCQLIKTFQIFLMTFTKSWEKMICEFVLTFPLIFQRVNNKLFLFSISFVNMEWQKSQSRGLWVSIWKILIWHNLQNLSRPLRSALFHFFTVVWRDWWQLDLRIDLRDFPVDEKSFNFVVLLAGQRDDRALSRARQATTSSYFEIAINFTFNIYR